MRTTAWILVSLTTPIWAISTLSYGKSERVDVERLGIYHLKGSPYEIGRDAMQLAPPESHILGAVPFMAGYLQKLIERQPFMMDREPFARFTDLFLERKYYRQLRQKVPTEYREIIRGMAAGSPHSYRSIERALMNPDVIYLAISDQLQGRLMPGGSSDESTRDPMTSNVPLLCSSVLIPGDYSADGKMIYGRVQDYPVIDAFDRYPSVFHIAKPGKYRYLSVATAGIALGGITVMNEHGLTMSMHTGATYDAAPDRLPGLVTTNAMIESARTIEEAVEVCNKNLPAAGWIINIADTQDRGRIGWIEVNPKGSCELSLSTKPLVTTNHYRTAEAKLSEISLGHSVDSSSLDRYRRLKQLVTKKGREFTPRDVMRILADKMDLTLGRPLAYGPSNIAALDQIVSVVFRPETGELYVSNGRSPTALTGQYIHLKFSDFDDLDRLRNRDGRLDIDIQKLLKGTDSDLTRWPAYPHYRAASVALNLYASTIDAKAALKHLDRAVVSEPKEVTLYWARALVRMQQGQLDPALKDLDFVLAAPPKLGLDPHRLRAAHLQRGKVLDALGNRKSAQAEYQLIMQDEQAAKPLKMAAQKFLEKAAKTKDLKRTFPDLKFMDTQTYD